MRSRWLSRALEPIDGGFVLHHPRSQRRAADLVWTSSALSIRHPDGTVDLDWGRIDDQWTISHHRILAEDGKSPTEAGCAVVALRDHPPAFSLAVASTRTLADGLREITTDRVPIARASVVVAARSRHAAVMLRALARVLAGTPVARARLADRERVERLCTDLAQGPRRAPRPTATSMLAPEIARSLVILGYTHPLGRPVAGLPAPDEDGAIAAVRADLANVDHRLLRHVLDEEPLVRRTVRALWSGIPPWPFAALVEA